MFYINLGNQKATMARTTQAQSIDSPSYVSSLSDKNKKAVLATVKTIAEAEEDEFEKKWETGLTKEELLKQVFEHIDSLPWKK